MIYDLKIQELIPGLRGYSPGLRPPPLRGGRVSCVFFFLSVFPGRAIKKRELYRY